uniref:Lipoyl-binding domain-containing protein n=1 Tax=Kalanchoe fedtschenkoi TaxID=63787 RepID=A0A7N1A218_KALFE
MESLAALRSFHYAVGAGASPQPGMLSFCNAASGSDGSVRISKLVRAPTNRRATVASCSKTTVSEKASDSIVESSAVKALINPTFPKGFEELILNVCDETEIAEVQLKIGDFQMQLKRNLAHATIPAPAVAPSAPPAPVAAKPETPPPSPPPKASPAKSSTFLNIPKEKSSKLVALEASGAAGYVLVSSPTVGSFHSGRTLKGKKQPPVCKEGDVIKEGQIIGYVDQFGTELPIKSDVAGEVLKLLLDEGDGIGYGDPLIAVLPAFHGIK